jgi:hypothetical protein
VFVNCQLVFGESANPLLAGKQHGFAEFTHIQRRLGFGFQPVDLIQGNSVTGSPQR